MYQSEQSIIVRKNYWIWGLIFLSAILVMSFWGWDISKNLAVINLSASKTATSCDCTKAEQAQIINIVKKYSPAVVSIVASSDVPKYEECLQTDSENAPTWCQNGTEKKRWGTGTGFIVTADGYIITNKHVVEKTDGTYTVFLNDENNSGTKYQAKVLARDPNNDIAVLKVEANNLPTVSLGQSDNLSVGQTVIAIGYALGEYDNTVSKGVVSGLSRYLIANGMDAGPEELRGMIQTDAAINPGNSGGPLIDLNGNVIGLNTAFNNAGQSIGFSIPVNLIKADFDEVKKTGSIAVVEVAFLGVRYTPVTFEMKDNLKLDYDYGMRVMKGASDSEWAVQPGSPAEQAGLQEGDIILSLNGKILNEKNLLTDEVRKYKPGDAITLTLYREGTVWTVKIILTKRDN